MAKTASTRTSTRLKKPEKEKPAAPVRDAKPAFGKAPPKRVAPTVNATARAVAKKAHPGSGKAAVRDNGKASIGRAAKAAAAVALGTVVATAKGVATLATSVTGRSRTKQAGKSK